MYRKRSQVPGFGRNVRPFFYAVTTQGLSGCLLIAEKGVDVRPLHLESAEQGGYWDGSTFPILTFFHSPTLYNLSN